MSPPPPDRVTIAGCATDRRDRDTGALPGGTVTIRASEDGSRRRWPAFSGVLNRHSVVIAVTG